MLADVSYLERSRSAIGLDFVTLVAGQGRHGERPKGRACTSPPLLLGGIEWPATTTTTPITSGTSSLRMVQRLLLL